MSKNANAKRTTANKRNAEKSSGPRTEIGKAISCQNSLRHGILSYLEVLPHLERQEEWEAHLEGVVNDIDPVGVLELALAERIALALWRLARVARYERAATVENLAEAEKWHLEGDGDALVARASEAAEEARQDSAMAAHLERMVPGDYVPANVAARIVERVADVTNLDLYGDREQGQPPDVELPELADGISLDEIEWTVGRLQHVLDMIVEYAEMDLATVLGVAVEMAEIARDAEVARVDQERREHMLPKTPDLEKLSRYENSLERSLFRSIHELQRLQVLRSCGNAPPLVAVDVTLGQTG